MCSTLWWVMTRWFGPKHISTRMVSTKWLGPSSLPTSRFQMIYQQASRSSFSVFGSTNTVSSYHLFLQSLEGEVWSSQRLTKCSQSSSAASWLQCWTLFTKTVFERSLARLWAQADGTGESMLIFSGEPIKINTGCSEAHRQRSPLYLRTSTRLLLDRHLRSELFIPKQI